MKYMYFKTIDTRQDYLGERYFKVDFSSDSVIQVCLSVGETKRGRGHMIGVYFISKMTFFSNYKAMEFVEPITKAQYEKQFKKVINYLI